MVEYKLKKDVVINGMAFQSGKVVNIPQSRIDEYENQIPEVPKKKIIKNNDPRHNQKKKKSIEGDTDEDKSKL